MAREPFTPVEEQAWRTFAALTTRLSSAMDTELQREAGVTHIEYRVMTALSEVRPGARLPLTELARLVGASLSRLSHVMTNLERRGLAVRWETPGLRGREANLTAAGRRSLQEMTPVYVDAVREMALDGLVGDQTAQLLALAQALLDQLADGMDRGIGLPTGRANRIPPMSGVTDGQP